MSFKDHEFVGAICTRTLRLKLSDPVQLVPFALSFVHGWAGGYL